MKKIGPWLRRALLWGTSLLILAGVVYLGRLLVLQGQYALFQNRLAEGVISAEKTGAHVQSAAGDVRFAPENLSLLYRMLQSARPAGMRRSPPSGDTVRADLGGGYTLLFTKMGANAVHVYYTCPDGRSFGFPLNSALEWDTLQKLTSPGGTLYPNAAWDG